MPPWKLSSEATFTIAPLPWATKTRPAARASARTHTRSTCRTRKASSAVTSSAGPRATMPAELTRMSRRPKAAVAASMARSHAAASAVSRSSSTSALRRPRPSISARVATGSPRSRWTMSQPASASATAAARPMPRVVPETQATRWSRRKLSSTPGTWRGYHRARGPALARARDVARPRVRRRQDRRRFPGGAPRALHGRSAAVCVSRRRLPARLSAGLGLASARGEARVLRAGAGPPRRHPRGGRTRGGAPARPVSPRRRARELTARARGARRRAARGVDAPYGGLRDRRAPSLLLRAGRRAPRPARAERDRDDVALHGPRGLVLRARRGTAARRHRLDVPLSDRADAAHRRPAGIPRRARARALTSERAGPVTPTGPARMSLQRRDAVAVEREDGGRDARR